MSRYHFNSVDGGRDPDPEGVELPDRRSARIYAARYLGELLNTEPETLWQAGHWCVEVTDDAGALLFSVIARTVDAPGSAAAD